MESIKKRSKALEIGDSITEFSLCNKEGVEWNSRRDRLDKFSIIYFYPKDESSICTKDACAFWDSFVAFKDAGVIKMYRKVLIWALMCYILVCLVGCKQNDTVRENKTESFTISGTVKGTIGDNSFAYLIYNDVQDSVKIVNNRFVFKGVVKDTISAQIGMSSAENAPQFYIENSPITVELSAQNTLKDGRKVTNLHLDAINGSYSSKIQEEYMQFYKANAGKKDFNTLLYSELNTFLPKHRFHPLSGAILAELALVNPVLTKDELKRLYSVIDTTKQDKQNLLLFKKGITQLNNYGVGKNFVDFELPNEKGDIIKFKDYRGKLVLIDFWASWCVPCREKNPELMEIYNQFNNNNFVIVSISSDKNKKQWINAINKDKLKWINLLDEHEELKNALGIKYIPYNFLIDEKGMISGVNLSIQELKEILAKRAKI